MKKKKCVFIDNANLYHAIKYLIKTQNKKLNYLRLRQFLSLGEETEFRLYYSIPSCPEDSLQEYKQYQKALRFYNGLRKLGYKTIQLPLRERIETDEYGVKTTFCEEKGLDCEIVYDMAVAALTGYYDSFILVAGDEDYARTVKRIREERKIPVSVAFFSHIGVSGVLMREATRFIDLTQQIWTLFTDSTAIRIT